MRDRTPRRFSGSVLCGAPGSIEIKSIRNRCAVRADSPGNRAVRELQSCGPVTAERVLILDSDTAQRGDLAGRCARRGSRSWRPPRPRTPSRSFAPPRSMECCARPGPVGWSCAAVISLARAGGSDAAFVVTCHREDVAGAIEALRNGADAYVVLPDDPVRTAVVVLRALEKRRMRREARDLATRPGPGCATWARRPTRRWSRRSSAGPRPPRPPCSCRERRAPGGRSSPR